MTTQPATLTLSAFLERCLADDEAAVAASSFDDPGWHGETFGRGYDCDADSELSCVYLTIRPARVLADVNAKRAIVARHSSCDDVSYGDDSSCPELRALASVYRGRDGWREEWA